MPWAAGSKSCTAILAAARAPSPVSSGMKPGKTVGTDYLDIHAVGVGSKILHRHLGGGERAQPGIVGVETGKIGEHADLDGNILGLRRRAEQRGESEDQTGYQSHCQPPWIRPFGP